MDQKQLTLFIETAQLGSFQQAALKNLLSQRAVSKRLRALEDEVGTPLFDRQRNQVVLTPAGQHFLTRAQEILETMHAASTEAQRLGTHHAQRLAVGYFSPFDGALLRPALGRLTPHYALTIEEKGMEHLISDVLLGHLDCAVILHHLPLDDPLDQVNLASETIFQGHTTMGISAALAGEGPTLAPQLLTQLPVIYYISEPSTYLETGFRHSVAPVVDHLTIHRVPSFEQLQLLVSLGQGVSFYPEELLSAVVNPHAAIVYRRLAGIDTANETFQLIYRKDRHHPGVRALLRELRQPANGR